LADNPDDTMRAYAGSLPAPEFDAPAWVTPPPLADTTVAIVTTAALHRAHDNGFTGSDTSYRVVERDVRDLVLGHWSPNFDRAGFAMDLDVVFPIDRLEELATDGVIGAVAPRHLAFAGNQEDTVTKVRLDSGPHAAALLRDDGVDVVVLTPV
jgi:D-proline reductase (dithiol) PrdB